MKLFDTDDVNDYINIVNYVDDILIPQVEIYFEIEKRKKTKKIAEYNILSRFYIR